MPEIGETKMIRRQRRRCRYIWVQCPICKKERWIFANGFKRTAQSGRCVSCYNKSQEAQNNRAKARASQHPPQGWKTRVGYKEIGLSLNDFFFPMTRSGGRIFEHRLIMAKHLNRCLLHWEVVHHKNGIKDDNRIENLELLADSRHHLIDSETKAYIHRLEGELADLKQKLGVVKEAEL